MLSSLEDREGLLPDSTIDRRRYLAVQYGWMAATDHNPMVSDYQ